MAMGLLLNFTHSALAGECPKPTEERPLHFSYFIDVPPEYDIYDIELEVTEIRENPYFSGVELIARMIGENEIEALHHFDPETMHVRWGGTWYTLEGFELQVTSWWLCQP